MKTFIFLILTVFAYGCVSINVKDTNPDTEFAAKPNWNSKWTNNYGYVSRLYPSDNKVYFSLKGGKTFMSPLRNYYYISISHPNYRAMVDLLYLAADKRWKLFVKTKNKLDANGFAEAEYFVVDPPNK